MSTLKTHNLQSPAASRVNIVMAPNAGMVVAGLSTYSNQINVGCNIKLGTAGVITATSFVGSGANLTSLPAQITFSNPTNNRILTSEGGIGVNCEPNLTYDGTTLKIGGDSGVTGTWGLEVYNTDTSNNLGKAVFAGNQGAEIKLQDTVSGETIRIAANGQASFYSEKAGDPMVFYTKPSGGSNTDRLRITSGGSVGINTDVSGNGSGAKLVVGGRIQSNAGGYWFAGANGAEDGWHVQDSSGNLTVVESGVAERLRITSNGSVNIGGDYSNSTYKLSVTGGSSQQMKVVGQEADIWLESTGGSSTYWRILGSTGGSTHRFRIYDQTNGGDRLNIDGNGQVTKPAQASFAAMKSGNQYSLNNEVFPFDTTTHNIGNHFNTSNYRFTAPVAGRYLFCFYSILATSGQGRYEILINGSAGQNGTRVHMTPTTTDWDHVSTSWILNLNANDYIQMGSQSNTQWHGGHWQRFCGELLS